MRGVRWAICGVCVCAACGKSIDDGSPRGNGGASIGGGFSTEGGAQHGGSESGAGASIIAGGSISGGGSAARGGSGGAAMTLGGSTSAGGAPGGGAAPLGGSMNSGGASGGTAGADGGHAGASAAGAAGMCDELLTCGCGCCTGSKPQVRCYYADDPTDRDGLVAADEAEHQSPGCSSAGCSLGVRYLCCKAPAPDSSPATYSASLIIGGYDRIQVVKIGTQFCPRLTFTDGKSGLRTALDGLSGWNLETGSYMSCAMSSLPQNVVGAGGSIKTRVSGSNCVLDMHFAVYALVNDELIPFRFDADGVPLSGASSTQCPGL